jgi:hypothetical protein
MSPPLAAMTAVLRDLLTNGPLVGAVGAPPPERVGSDGAEPAPLDLRGRGARRGRTP